VKGNLKLAAGRKTVKKLIGVSKQLFTERGYDNTTLEDVAKMAGLTRGALYHHFGGKKGLFQAVLENVLYDYFVQLEKKLMAFQNPWEKLLEFTYDFLKACTTPVISQIVIVDSSSVLGMNVLVEIDEEFTMGLIKNILSELKNSKKNIPINIDIIANIIYGSTQQLGLYIAHEEDPQKAFLESYSTMKLLFSPLKNDYE